MLNGKGYFIWQIEKCAPDAATLVARAQDAGLGHVLIKIADGDKIYPIGDNDGSKERLTRESIAALKSAGIQVWGWSFIYGSNPAPAAQAQRLVQRMHQLGVEGAVVNAEKLPNNPWTTENAKRFMGTLVEGLGRAGFANPMLALSSYRYISFHSDFPFDEFMLFCQVAMPQVYWVAKNGGDPVRNLQEAYSEYMNRYPGKVFIPTGAAYGEQQGTGTSSFYWEATAAQITMFLNQAQAMDLPAVNFWSWQHAWERPALWDAVSAFPLGQEIVPISVASTPPTRDPNQLAPSGTVTPGRVLPTTTTPPTTNTTVAIPNTPLTPAVGLPDSADDDGEAVILVGAPGYQEGIYAGASAELSHFIRGNYQCTWVKGERQKSSAYAQWLPRISKNGEYLIEAWIPGVNATTRRARYHITGVVGQDSTIVVEVNQLNFSDDWVRLGFFELDGAHQFSGMVALNNLVGTEANTDTRVAFGPIRWRRIERTGVQPGFCDGFDSPVGTQDERRLPNEQWGPRKANGPYQNWNGPWLDANPFLSLYFLGYHTGVDLNLPGDKDKGAPAYSIADGEVIYSGIARNRDGSVSGFGTLVIIKHDPYLSPEGKVIVAYSRYAHMKDLVVEKGQRVRRGDPVGTIWNKGTQAMHLHFDISTSGILETNPGHWPGNRKNEVEKHYVDPYDFIRAYRPR